MPGRGAGSPGPNFYIAMSPRHYNLGGRVVIRLTCVAGRRAAWCGPFRCVAEPGVFGPAGIWE